MAQLATPYTTYKLPPYTVRYVQQVTNIMRGVCRRNWNLNLQIIRSVYERGTDRTVLYAEEAWSPRGGSCRLRKKLVQTQRPVLLTLTKTYRSAYPFALQFLARPPSLEYILDVEEKYYEIRKSIDIDNVCYIPDVLEKLDAEWQHLRRTVPYRWTKLEHNMDLKDYINSSKIN